eukprot:TRINITY_DN3301_c0_g1_i1.p1 TRINITY_DN3301_c0_g1~~TRINITY_DN3301_c0_g1_i1.p1  ORF type:complete len:426 (-),score=43.06 TRINITY_DN3301_c0_g1_i1:366-1643(-)
MAGHWRCLLTVVLGSLAPKMCLAHGKLTTPTPRDGISVGRAGIDQNNDVTFEPGCRKGNTCDAFVCRESAPNPNVPVTRVTAGGSLNLGWSFTAFHVGDCAVYISYDVDKPRSQQKYVKIANLFDCKSYPSRSIRIPASLPSGRAILRWDWAALHVWPKVEFYVQCVDIQISSTSAVSPNSLDSYSLINPPVYPDDGNDGVGYRNAFSRGAPQEMTGPSCIDNTINDCQLTAPGTPRNTDDRRGGTPALPAPVPVPVPAPVPAPVPTPVPTPPAPRCLPIGDCGAYSWCDQNLFEEYCAFQEVVCPAPFCRTSNSPAPTPVPVETPVAPVPVPVPMPSPAPIPSTPPTVGRRCVPTLEGFYSDANVYGPVCEAQGTANVCSAPICKWEGALVQLGKVRKHSFLGTALLQSGADVERAMAASENEL